MRNDTDFGSGLLFRCYRPSCSPTHRLILESGTLCELQQCWRKHLHWFTQRDETCPLDDGCGVTGHIIEFSHLLMETFFLCCAGSGGDEQENSLDTERWVYSQRECHTVALWIILIWPQICSSQQVVLNGAGKKMSLLGVSWTGGGWWNKMQRKCAENICKRSKGNSFLPTTSATTNIKSGRIRSVFRHNCGQRCPITEWKGYYSSLYWESVFFEWNEFKPLIK